MLYLTYAGDLKQDITELDFLDDFSNDTEAERFRKHHRFLRTLKEDSLLIVDNFNATATQDDFLSVMLGYRCRILFTTRSRLEHYENMELAEISDSTALLHFVARYFPEAPEHETVLEEIIRTVHAHTLAVELAARLLGKGLLSPQELLHKLLQSMLLWMLRIRLALPRMEKPVKRLTMGIFIRFSRCIY